MDLQHYVKSERLVRGLKWPARLVSISLIRAWRDVREGCAQFWRDFCAAVWVRVTLVR